MMIRKNIKTVKFLRQYTKLNENFINELVGYESIYELVRNFSKMTPREQKYLLNSFNIEKLEAKNKKEKLYPMEIAHIVMDKLEAIMVLKNESSSLINLEELYMILKPENIMLYDELVHNYLKFYRNISAEKKEQYKNSIDIINIIINSEDGEKLLKDTPLYEEKMYNLINLSAKKIVRLLNNYEIPITEKKAIVSALINSQECVEIINSISYIEFEEILKYLYNENNSHHEDYSIKLKLLPFCIEKKKDKITMNTRMLENLEKMDFKLIEEISNNCNYKEIQKFLDHIKNYKITDLLFVINYAKYKEYLETMVLKEEFYQLNPIIQLNIINELRTVSITDKNNYNQTTYEKETNFERYKKKMEFLIMDKIEENTGFISCLPNNRNYLDETLKFLCTKSDLTVIEEKIIALKEISQQLKDNLISIDNYKKYLSYLDFDLSEKKSEEQVEIIRSRRKYFKTNNINTFFNNLDKNSDNDILKKLPNNQTPTQMEYMLKFIEKIDRFNEEIIEEIIEKLENSQSEETSKTILDFVTTEGFYNLSPEEQKEFLDFIPGKKQEFNSENSSSKVYISDIDYVERIINQNGGEMTFENKDAGIKVKVITSKK